MCIILSRNPLLNGLACTQLSHNTSHTAHREHRTRDRDHAHRRSRQPLDPQSPASNMVLAPSPAVVKTGRRATQQEGSRGGSREHISVQPLAPNSRRASQHRADPARERDSALVSQHPYASATNNQNGALRSTAYGGSSPVQYNGMGQLSNGHANSPIMPNSSDFMYGGQQRQANGDMATATSRSNGAITNTNKNVNVYGEQNGATPDQDEHGGRKRSFWAALCCRG